MPAIDRKKNIRVRDRATMTKLLLGLDGYTVSSGASSKMYSSDIVAIPLKIEDFLRVGIIRRQGIDLSQPGKTFVDATLAKMTKGAGVAITWSGSRS